MSNTALCFCVFSASEVDARPARDRANLVALFVYVRGHARDGVKWHLCGGYTIVLKHV